MEDMEDYFDEGDLREINSAQKTVYASTTMVFQEMRKTSYTRIQGKY